MSSDDASRMLGIQLTDYGPGWARTRTTVRDDMVNGHGMCHGGLIFSLADTAFACAWATAGVRSPWLPGATLFSSRRPAPDVLTAEARMRSRYGRNGIYDVTVTHGDRLVAEFRGRSHQVR